MVGRCHRHHRQGAAGGERGVFDGRQLTLVNFSDLIIKGGKNASIEVDPRYAFCFNLVNCDHVQLLNLTIGHTEEALALAVSSG